MKDDERAVRRRGVMAALDLDNYSEAIQWFNNPKFLMDTEKL